MRKCMLLIVFVLGSFLLHAQRNYAVMVTDSKTGNAIVGASVKIMSTSKTLLTSESGNLVMAIPSDDSLLVTAKGYKERKLQMAGQFIALSIVLEPETKTAKVALKPKKKKATKPSN